MDFALSREQALFERGIRRFADGVVRPAAAEADERGAFAPAVLQQTAAAGLFGLLVPAEYGGAGVDTVRWVLAVERVAHACGALASMLIAHGALVCVPLAAGGSAAQRARWLPDLATGARLGAGMCPASLDGSAPPSLTATRDDAETRLHGRLAGMINAGPGALYLLWPALSEGAVRGGVVPAEVLGPAALAPVERIGLRGAPVTDVGLTGCRLPDDALLPTADAALATAVSDLFSLSVAAQALGIAQAALDAAVAYAGERRQFGRPIGEFEGLRWLLADLRLAVQSARLLVWQAAWQRDAGLPFGEAAALAKLAAAAAATNTAVKAVQVHGGYGYLRDSAVQRYLRDAKGTEVAAGTAGAHRARIADALLPPPA